MKLTLDLNLETSFSLLYKWLLTVIAILVASEAMVTTSDLEFELIGLNNPYSSAYLAAKCFSELNVPEEESQIPSIDSLGAKRARS